MMIAQAIALAIVVQVFGTPPPTSNVDVWRSFQVPQSVYCDQDDGSLPAYFMQTGKQMISEWGSLVYLGTTEQNCQNMCSDNRDSRGAYILCASATFHPDNLNCTISRQRVIPSGVNEIGPMPDAIMYEKFCLPKNADVECSEAKFLRVDQAILPGFAYDVMKSETLEDCVNMCVTYEKHQCKSVMFYYEDKECVLSGESTANLDNLKLFVVEPKDKVIYVENGCLDDSKATIRFPKVPRKPGPPTKETKPIDVNMPVVREIEQIENTLTEVNVKPGVVVDSDNIYMPWSDWSGCSGGRRVRIRACMEGNTCSGPFIEHDECPSWGEWTICFPFPPDVLKDRCVGFERRDCVGDPSRCVGHRFRYCVMPGCNGATSTV